MSHSPKSLYEISLNVFCEFLYNWSQPTPLGKNHGENPALLRLMNVENHPPINQIFSNIHTRTSQWMLSSRPSSTDNLAAYNNFDDKISFKKSCHNLISTFFGRKSLESLEEESIKQMTSSNLLYRISENICQDIIRHFQTNFKINDRTLSFPLFDGDVNTITNLQIEDATQITVDGLKVLKKHNLVRIKMAHLTNCTITELINNLSSWSIWNLESFSVPHCSLTRFNKICIILSLTRLTNLVHLDVSYTSSFNNQCLEIITDHLTNLKSLDLTSTKISILKPLLKLLRLTRLNLHNVALTCKDEFILGDLIGLKSLDISDERFSIEPQRYSIYDHLQDFFEKFFFLEHLSELDISGRNISAKLVCQLVTHRLEEHKRNPKFRPLRFLGLMLTEFSFSQMLELHAITKGKLSITGNGKLIHVIQSLIRYKQRPIFIQKALIYLCDYTCLDNMEELPPPPPSPPKDEDIFNLYNDDDDDDNINFDYDNEKEILANESRLQPNEIFYYQVPLVQMMVDIMETHIKNLHLIISSSGNLYNLTKNNAYLHSYLLKRVVNVCIETMKHYSTEYQIIKNILLILCSDRILKDISFDRYTCIRLVMDTLFTFRDYSIINKLALGICAILASKIPTMENVLMGSQSVYLKRLLDLVQENYYVNSQNNEVILKLSLSTLWNFTDEAPKTCQTFIKHNGIKLYVNILVLFEGKNYIESKVLGLLNNIAEVFYLRTHLIQWKLLHQLRKLIYSDQIDVSYFAIGILVQLASDQKLNWNDIKDFELNNVLEDMFNIIQSWPNPSFEMVAYRSFEPFTSLLLNNRHSSISLWALWAIHHVCTKNPKRYYRMMHEEKYIQTIILILTQRLQKQYAFYCAQQRKQISQRLIDFVSVSDDLFQVLSKTTTKWNCHIIHKWNILIEPQSPSSPLEENVYECLNKPGMENDQRKLTSESCDCILKYHLEHDPFLRLPSIILKSFHCFSPIPLNLEC